MQQITGADRLLVWDSAGEWHRKRPLAPVRSLRALGEFITLELRGELPDFRMAYTGPVTREHFDTFCRLAWCWLRHSRGVLVVEELADVTSPGKAPAAWGEIVRKHRHAGGRVYGLTQRPAESDKTLVGNATVIHAGRMNMATDRDYMARVLDVPLPTVTALKDLDYLERNMRTHALKKGRVFFR